MKIDMQLFCEEIGLFLARLTPTDDQKHYLKFAENDVRSKLLTEAEKSGYSIERVLLTALCGELKTQKQQAEFVSRLILLNILTEGME